jgi:hypothetical protein
MLIQSPGCQREGPGGQTMAQCRRFDIGDASDYGLAPRGPRLKNRVATGKKIWEKRKLGLYRARGAEVIIYV